MRLGVILLAFGALYAIALVAAGPLAARRPSSLTLAALTKPLTLSLNALLALVAVLALLAIRAILAIATWWASIRRRCAGIGS